MLADQWKPSKEEEARGWKDLLSFSPRHCWADSVSSSYLLLTPWVPLSNLTAP